MGIHVKYPLRHCQILIKLEFSLRFLGILKYQISRKYVQWEPSCSMRTEGQKDMAKLVVAFRKYASASKNKMHMNSTMKHFVQMGRQRQGPGTSSVSYYCSSATPADTRMPSALNSLWAISNKWFKRRNEVLKKGPPTKICFSGPTISQFF